jgi:3-hydroxyisobutyrate dehydrogenase-like beta-hydroxyacid dehydrogenase
LKSRFSTIGNIDKPIGLVGVGHMGEKIAKNLAKDGYIVHIYDLNLAKLEALESPSITPKVSLKAYNTFDLI